MSGRKAGSTSLIQQAYNSLLRPHLPRKWRVINGVAVRDSALLDAVDHYPHKMEGFINAIRERVSDGDVVVDIATGRAVAAVWAARAGADTVHSYEADRNRVSISRETVSVSDVSGIEIHHAVVAEPSDVVGPIGNADRLSPADLPECDVLQLDVEGAEVSILDGLGQRPRAVIVETHPNHGVSAKQPASILRDMGYSVESRDYEPRKPEKSVLVATLNGGGKR